MGFIYKVTFYYFCQQLVGAFGEQCQQLQVCQQQRQRQQQQRQHRQRGESLRLYLTNHRKTRRAQPRRDTKK